MTELIQEFLRHADVRYTTLPHKAAFTAQEEAAAVHVPGRDWAKVVVCFADDEPIQAVVPADVTVNLERLLLLTDAQEIRLAREDELDSLFPDCETGAMPALGPLYRQRVFVDEALTREPAVVFNAGTHTDAIGMSYADFAAINRPIVGHFGERPVH